MAKPESFEGHEALRTAFIKGVDFQRHFSASPTYDTITMSPTKTNSNTSESSRPRKASTQRPSLKLQKPIKPRKIPKILRGIVSNISLRVFNLLIIVIASIYLRNQVERFCERRRRNVMFPLAHKYRY